MHLMDDYYELIIWPLIIYLYPKEFTVRSEARYHAVVVELTSKVEEQLFSEAYGDSK